MSTLGTSIPLELDVLARRTESAGSPETAALLSRREAALRSAATVCLVGIATVQAIGLPPLFKQGGQLAALSLGAMALCLGLALALVASPARASRPVWRAVATGSAVLLLGWLALHVFAVPGLTASQGAWTALPGSLAAVFAAVTFGVAAAAAPPRRVSVRGIATTAAVIVAMTPGVAAFLVAAGPGTLAGETSLAADTHIHLQGNAENSIVFQAGANGGSFVYKVATPARQSPIGIALILAAGFVFSYGALGYLRRRTDPSIDLDLGSAS
jgi:hypothetical protein